MGIGNLEGQESGIMVMGHPLDPKGNLALYNKGFWDAGIAGEKWVIECDLHNESVSVSGEEAVDKALADTNWCNGCKKAVKSSLTIELPAHTYQA